MRSLVANAAMRLTVFVLSAFIGLAPCFGGSMLLLGTGSGGGGGSPMATPLVLVTGNLTPSNSTTNYGVISGGALLTNSPFLASQTFIEVPSAIAGTISNLVVNFQTVLTQGTFTVSLVKNGSATPTALTCQITTSSASCTDITDTVAVSPSDLLSWQVVPSGTPTAQTVSVQISAVFTSSNPGESLIVACCKFTSTTVANYLSFGGYNSPTTTDAAASSVVPTNGVISKLNIKTSSNVSGGNYAFTVMQNGSPTAVGCTVLSGASTCTDSSNSISIAAGDLISLQGCPGGTPGACTPSGTVTTNDVKASVRWVPTIAGEAVLLASGGVPSTSGTDFGGVTGYQITTGEPRALTIAPIASTVKKLFVSQDVAPGGSTTRTVTLRQGTGSGQADTALTCTVASAATTCSDVSHTYSATLNNLLNWDTVPTGTNAALADFRVGVVVTIP